jgi:RHS repeat-associated protein
VDKVVWQPWATPPATLAEAVDSFLTYTTGGNANWRTCLDGYFDNDSARSGTLGNSQESWMQTTVSGPGTIRFWWKVSSEAYYDWLEFWVDGVQQDSISGEVDWTETSYAVTGTGSHTLKWRYAKDGSGSDGEDCAYVDYVQWTGPLPQDPPADAWRELTYVYDASGRRIEKRYDGLTILKYIYDGDSCIAEYDASGNLRRKYIYGPGIDQPVCMIESTMTPAATYYYHFDASGSVVALTNSSGNTVEVYDYSVYGQVGATDPSHTNRFMFTGREFDKETGLYYYRARYYKPEIGRFLQVDPVGYGAGMNLYRYCSNNPWNMADPFGNDPCLIHGWYYSPNCAALAADEYISHLPEAASKEFFYFIVERDTTPNLEGGLEYAWTEPVRGEANNVPWKVIKDHAKAVRKEGFKKKDFVGWGHNHPRSGDPAVDRANETFSGAAGDEGFTEDWHIKEGYDNFWVMYLLTPSGVTKGGGPRFGGITTTIATWRPDGSGGECKDNGGKVPDKKG